MVQPTIKKHQRPAALKLRIDKMKVRLVELEDLLAAMPVPPPDAAMPPDTNQIPAESHPSTPPDGPGPTASPPQDDDDTE